MYIQIFNFLFSDIFTLMNFQLTNPIQLKEKVTAFKKHLLNLQNSRSFISKSKNEQNYPIRPINTNLINKYQKVRLQSIYIGNMNLLQKMIKIQSVHSQYNKSSTYSSIKNFKENYLKTKYDQRRRFLSQISKQNKSLSKKLSRCMSQYKSSCFQWRNDIHKQEYFKNLVSKKQNRHVHDLRVLAQNQLGQNKKKKLKLFQKNTYKQVQYQKNI